MTNKKEWNDQYFFSFNLNHFLNRVQHYAPDVMSYDNVCFAD